MQNWLDGIDLLSGVLLIGVSLVAGAAVVVVTLVRPRAVWIAIAVAAGALGTGIGLALCRWAESPSTFDTALDPLGRAGVVGAFGALGVLSAALVRGGRWRRFLAAAGVVLALTAGALAVNAEFGQYPTVGALIGQPAAEALPAGVAARQRSGAPLFADRTRVGAPPADWRGTSGGQRGLVAQVEIPGTTSHFPARPAYVYLPPAALASDPPALPVMVMLSGQPGGPGDVVRAGHLRGIMDAWAARDGGLAPIVVVPDQLGSPTANPMCLDSPLGASASYLTRDVPRWIRTHLTVEPDAAHWAIGGFSQGGTCAIQLGAAHPELFSAIVDVSGQVTPRNGDTANTIAVGFGGSASAYMAARPATILAAHAPYTGTTAVFGYGSRDAQYGPGVQRMRRAAAAAGIATSRVVSPGTGHEWATVRYVLSSGIEPVLAHLGVGPVS
ncbi:alpha/beta hydrolase-fold protein [Rathayibacter sp. YIM 133350]|uniref:alpha/beta hydrolase n=1 Tax=Rathayibacter sp. YIM 133350 TaxID=3131992 RepID=UPI00307DCEC4